MSEYNLKITGDMAKGDLKNIKDYICLVGAEDKFTITLDKEKNNNSEKITKMFEENNLVIVSETSLDNSAYEITYARKK